MQDPATAQRGSESGPPSPSGRPRTGTDDGIPSSQSDGVELSPEMRRDFAVVVPAYNEAQVTPDLVRELRTQA